MKEIAVEQSPAATLHAKVHRGMCEELAALVNKLAEALPALDAERHCWQKSGMQAFCMLQMALEKSRALLQYCAHSSKLYLAINGHSILYKFECLREELEESVRRLSFLVPQHLSLQMAELESEVEKTMFVIDPEEKQIGAEITSLLLQNQKGGYFDNPQVEEATFNQIRSKLALTSPAAINLEKAALKRQLEKAQKEQDRKKEAMIVNFFYLIKKYDSGLQCGSGEKLACVSHYSLSKLSWSGSLGDADSGKSSHYSNFNSSEVESEVDVPGISMSAIVPLAPEEFRCPISLQLMCNPVIIASGQTYERVCIEKWFQKGHNTCPKTQQRLEHLNLTANYCVKGLIAGWCEARGIPVPEPPFPPPSPILSPTCDGRSASELEKDLLNEHIQMERIAGDLRYNSEKASEASTHEQQCGGSEASSHKQCGTSVIGSFMNYIPDERELEITEATSPDGLALLVLNLKSRSWEVQCRAAEQIRFHTKNSAEARLLIGKGGAISSLVDLLYCCIDLNDMKAQETCTFALLNMAVHNDRNKAQVVNAGAVPLLVKLLKAGQTQSVKEAAAAALLTLSCLDDDKACIGSFGAVPLLVQLLISGSNQGRKDALTTLYNLTICMGNRHRVIRAGAIPILVHLLSLRKVDIVERCIALLYNLSFTEEGRACIGQTDRAISTFAAILETGSVKEKEHVAATLLLLCTNNLELNQAVLKEGVIPALVRLSVNGTLRARAKASSLLQHFRDQRNKVVSFCEEQFSNYSEEEASKGGKAKGNSIPSRMQRLGKSRLLLFKFSCKPRMCSTVCNGATVLAPNSVRLGL